MKYINRIEDFLEKRKDNVNDYNCVMIYLNISNWDKIQENIDEDDLYIDINDDSYGREDNPHITLIYGIHDIPDSEISNDLRNININDIKFKGVSVFNNDKFDVLKFDIDSNEMVSYNTLFVSKYPNTNDYTYHPHCTIAYLKPGKSDKYVDMINKDIQFKIEGVVYSKIDGSKKYYNINNNIS